ncbi:superoxide dismutase family protein [Niastella populi]|uniref:Superoxide dismutase [Cu-Zn] n=1 Tax=Niastella populi TaxID=550983 RepID=A0A1V9EVV6_9BACT|nr:superoxide dismutase family protein [Niastella populi]OQP50251.1 hypothetical protein A4R26_29950 [Niastella populi]
MQKISSTIMLLSVTLFVLACNDQQKNEPQMSTATIKGLKPDTAVSGMATFTKDGNKVKMNLQLTIPSKANESVAVHIHENGNCGDTGMAAGGHWNPTNALHGQWGSSNFHLGDIGNVSLDASGNGSMELESDKWSLGEKSDMDILNKTIIVHSGTDDYSSQPSGNAGGRIGCGIIVSTQTGN